jgi:ketosteroid isomerase-like protein
MKQLLTVLVIVLITSLFIACNSNTASESGTNTATEKEMKSFDLAAAKKAIDSTNVVFGSLVAKGDSVGLASLYTSDGKFMAEHMPTASGRSAIQTAFSGMFAAIGTPGLTLTANEVSGNEEMVSEVGTYSMKDKSGKEFDKGKYIVLWKMEDGKWKLHRDIFNSDMPPMPMAPTKK